MILLLQLCLSFEVVILRHGFSVENEYIDEVAITKDLLQISQILGLYMKNILNGWFILR